MNTNKLISVNFSVVWFMEFKQHIVTKLFSIIFSKTKSLKLKKALKYKVRYW